MPLHDISADIGQDWLPFTPNLEGATGITVNTALYLQIGKLVHVTIDCDFTTSQTYAYFSLPVNVIPGSNPFHYAVGVGGDSGDVFQSGAVFQVGWNSNLSSLDQSLCSVYKPNFAAWSGSGPAAFSGMFFYPAP